MRANEVYVGKIRNGNLYVLLKITATNPATKTPNGTVEDNIYFEFDYKYTTATTGFLEAANTFNGNIFPNPANEVLNITRGEATPATLELVDLTGKVVASQHLTSTQEQLNVSNIPSGLYLLKFIGLNSISTTRILIQH